jgi:hypothetical protein
VNSKTLTWVLGAVAGSLAVVLAVVLLNRPSVETTAAPTVDRSSASGPSIAASPSSSVPTTRETDLTAEGGPNPLPSSEVDAHDASPGATPFSQTDEARSQWTPVATGFGRAFTATEGKTAAEWRASLAPFVTKKVRDQLATIDVRNVPKGTFTGIEPADYGEDKVAVFLHHDSGLTLVAYLIMDGASWRIYAYDRWED